VDQVPSGEIGVAEGEGVFHIVNKTDESEQFRLDLCIFTYVGLLCR